MDERTSQGVRTLSVRCVWCGSEIRKGDAPESSGMCQACFRQMADEHIRRAAPKADAHASDR